MKAENCALFILAAGLSTRFGIEDKLMENLGGKPVLSHVIQTAATVPFAKCYGIIPITSKRRRELLQSQDFEVLENPSPKTGQGSSLILAAEQAISEDFEGICILLGDMPFVPSVHLKSLMDALSDKESAISLCNQIIMPPMALRRSQLDLLSKINPKQGAKSLFKNENSAYLPLSNDAAQDIDTPENLARLNARLDA